MPRCSVTFSRITAAVTDNLRRKRALTSLWTEVVMNAETRWRVVATLSSSTDDAIARPAREIVLAKGESLTYDPDLVDAVVKSGVVEALAAIDRIESDGGAVDGVEFSVMPVLPDGLRPSFSLSAEAISALSKLNASLDFDPY